jgi:hypothetical protein
VLAAFKKVRCGAVFLNPEVLPLRVRRVDTERE